MPVLLFGPIKHVVANLNTGKDTSRILLQHHGKLLHPLGWIRPFPFVGQLLDGSRFCHFFEGCESVQNNPPLPAHVAGFTEHAASSKFDEQGTGGLDARHPVGRVPHGDGRYPCVFDHPLNQTHGLMAFRSDRHKEKDVNRLGLNP